jgi:hypothetical protein
MFDNEPGVGSTFQNFVKTGTPLLGDNSALLSDSARLYAYALNNIGVHTLTHTARMDDYVNDFRQEIIFVGMIDDGAAAATLNDTVQFDVLDSLGATIIRIELRGDTSIRITDSTGLHTSPVGVFVLGDLVEVKLELSWTNDTFRTLYDIRAYIDGFEYRYDGGGALGVYNGAAFSNVFVNAQATKQDYYRVTFTQANNVETMFSYCSWKNFADMDSLVPSGLQNRTILFKEVIVLSNDRATFIPIGDNVGSFQIKESLNNIDTAWIKVRSADPMSIITDRITDDDSDNDQDNFTYDAEVRVFVQCSRIQAEGVDGQTNIGPARLVDLNATFQTDGVEAGDWVYTWNSDGNHEIPRQITSVVSQTEVRVDADWVSIGTVLRYYTIVKGHYNYHQRFLGDYIYTGEFEKYTLHWAERDTYVMLLCHDYSFRLTKKLVWCWTTKFYNKDFDRIFNGWITEELFTGWLSGVPSYMSQYGLFSQSLWNMLYDTNLTELRSLFTFVFRENEYLYDAIKEVCDKGFLQWVVFYDRENVSQRYLWFRDIPDKSVNQITFIKGGSAADTNIMEDTKHAVTMDYSKGKDTYVDGTLVTGNFDDTGVTRVGATSPIGFIADRDSREMFESDQYIWNSNQAQQKADAITGDLSRIPPSGMIPTEWFPPRDTWSIPDAVTWDDDGRYPYPGAPGPITHGSVQTRATNGSSNSGIVGAQKHSQGLEYRKPFSRIGESGSLGLPNGFTEDFIAYELVTDLTPDQFFTTLRPETKPWDVGLELSNVRRDIDRVAQNFKDPDIDECMSIVAEDEVELSEHFGVAEIADDISGFTDNGGQQATIEFTPFDYTDAVDSQTAYSYMLYYRAGGGPPGTPWIALPLVVSGLNEITNIDDTTFAPSIRMNNDPGGDFGYTAPDNWVNVQFPAIPGPLTYDVLIILRARFVTASGNLDVPANTPPTWTPVPPLPAPAQDDEFLELAQVSGSAESLSYGTFALIDWSAVTVA